jgi:hypothetical protein
MIVSGLSTHTLRILEIHQGTDQLIDQRLSKLHVTFVGHEAAGADPVVEMRQVLDTRYRLGRLHGRKRLEPSREFTSGFLLTLRGCIAHEASPGLFRPPATPG